MAFAVFLLSTMACTAAFAADVGYESGVSDGVQYKEMVYITGEPIEFQGTLRVSSTPPRNNSQRITYTYTLANSQHKATLRRTVTLNVQFKSTGNQVLSTVSMANMSENATIDGVSYSLRSPNYSFSASSVTDERPAISYFASNWVYKKVYDINRTEGNVTVEMTGKSSGYSSAWGTSEERKVNISISYNRMPKNGGSVRWQGSVYEEGGNSSAKSIVYTKNDPQYISFKGNYVVKSQGQDVLQYTYNLPRWNNGVLSSERVEKSGMLAVNMTPEITQPLAVGEKRDIKGHWAEDSIKKILALGVFQGSSDYFGPALPVKRADFARAIAIVAGIKIDDSTGSMSISVRNRSNTPEVSPFLDVSVNNSDYKYIKAVASSGLMEGTSPNTFSPSQSLTREQAITIAIRALGLESLAPAGQYHTPFADDFKISPWARDCVYVAHLVGLIQGDEYNRVNPQQVMTRAEVSVFLDRFIQFLSDDMVKDYVNRVLNF